MQDTGYRIRDTGCGMQDAGLSISPRYLESGILHRAFSGSFDQSHGIAPWIDHGGHFNSPTHIGGIV